MFRPFAGSFAAALLPVVLGAQIVCPSGAAASYFGWKSTECGNCAVYGSYLEYMTPPRIRDIEAGGPADGRLRENDVLLAVDGAAITTAAAWHRLRDARAGEHVRFRMERGRDTVETTVVATEHCVPMTRGEQAKIGAQSPRSDPSRITSGRRSFEVGRSVVEVEGRPDSVSYDPATGRLSVASGRVVVRVRPRTP
jgi:hypothetical protein